MALYQSYSTGSPWAKLRDPDSERRAVERGIGSVTTMHMVSGRSIVARPV